MEGRCFCRRNFDLPPRSVGPSHWYSAFPPRAKGALMGPARNRLSIQNLRMTQIRSGPRDRKTLKRHARPAIPTAVRTVRRPVRKMLRQLSNAMPARLLLTAVMTPNCSEDSRRQLEGSNCSSECPGVGVAEDYAPPCRADKVTLFVNSPPCHPQNPHHSGRRPAISPAKTCQLSLRDFASFPLGQLGIGNLTEIGTVFKLVPHTPAAHTLGPPHPLGGCHP